MEILLTIGLNNALLEKISMLFILEGNVYFFRIKWVIKIWL